MAEDHRRTDTRSTRVTLLEDSSFLKDIVQRVLQELLGAEMSKNIGALPTNALRGAQAIATATNQGRSEAGWGP